MRTLFWVADRKTQEGFEMTKQHFEEINGKIIEAMKNSDTTIEFGGKTLDLKRAKSLMRDISLVK